MVHQSRDTGIREIRARKDQRCYGMGLGILILDDVYPGFPGDVRNASGYPFPIQYEIVEGVDIHRLVVDEDKSPCLEPVLRSAHKLEKMGCRAIAGECGYFAYFQREVAASVRLPVFLSSLLQVPLAEQVVGPEQVVGILVANANYLTERHLLSVGIQPETNYVVGGAMESLQCQEFDHLWTAGLRSDPPGANYEKAEAEFLSVAIDFYRQHANMGAMVLECTGFPPFARALQREIDIPIFSWGTLLDYAFSVVVHRDYYGHV
jgi:hypothetical protein